MLSCRGVDVPPAMQLFDKEQMAAFADKIKNKEKERKEDL